MKKWKKIFFSTTFWNKRIAEEYTVEIKRTGIWTAKKGLKLNYLFIKYVPNAPNEIILKQNENIMK